MIELVILSGKGGTGKTTIAASFAALASSAVLVDCDVDAPDLHLLFADSPSTRQPFFGLSKATINQELCFQCGLCLLKCRFDAVTRQEHQHTSAEAGGESYRIDPLACEGCRLCIRMCPASAITEVPNQAGEWLVSETDIGPLVYGRLGIGQQNSGKLVSEVKAAGRQSAKRCSAEWLIVDGPPGIGCPAISSLAGAHYMLAVTEPTLSGAHDLERVLDLAAHFGVPSGVCVNRYDINGEQVALLRQLASERGVDVLGQIPFDADVNASIQAGRPLVSHSNGLAAQSVRALWSHLAGMLGPREHRQTQ